MARPVFTFVVVALMVASVVAQEPQEERRESEITGRITVDGRPLEEGRILFYSDDGQIFGCVYKGGEFTIRNAWTGKFRVTVEGANVSERYSAPDTSALQVEIRRGKNVIEFVLHSPSKAPACGPQR